LGHDEARVALAALLGEVSVIDSIALYRAAAQNGHSKAQIELAKLLVSGKLGEPQYLEALHCLLQGALSKDALAASELWLLVANSQQELIDESLIAAANNGNVEAEFALGRKFSLGHGVVVDHVLAYRWYRKAAEKGHAQAQCAVAGYYQKGEVVAQDFVSAFSWFSKAAEQGDSKAQWNIGSMFASGALSVKKDLKQAFAWCSRAAKSGFVPAQATLGVLFARIKDFEQATHWLSKAALANDQEAQFNLGLMYLKGQGVERSTLKAFEYFLAAAEGGLGNAQSRIGLMYATGEGVPMDPIEAHKWYLIADECGDKSAVQNLKRSEQILLESQISESKRRAARWLHLISGKPLGPQSD
jgi:TPR repeat protein